MRVFTYVVRFDGGFAPNPFHNWCTLACCKPKIRKGAVPDDWVVGLVPKPRGGGIVYAMRVEESLDFAAYWRDPRFVAKQPTWTDDVTVERCGDNCYRPIRGGGFRQLRSTHWDHEHDREHERAKARDLGGERVLVSRHFAYFGAEPVPLPAHLAFARAGRGHRVRFDDEQVRLLAAFLEALPPGRHGDPLGFVEAGVSTRCGARTAPCG